MAWIMASLLKAKRLIWGLIFLLVTATAALSYVAGTRYMATVVAVEQAVAVQSAIERALSLLKDAETAQRGFLLTGDPEFLSPYDLARGELPRPVADLKQFAAHDSSQTRRVRDLERLTGEKLAFIDDAIKARREGDGTGATALVRSGRGKHLMDEIRAVGRRMSEHERSILVERRRDAEAAKGTATWGVSLGSLLSVLLALFSFLTVTRDMKALRRAADDVAASEAHFRLLTEKTSDLVRLFDPDGKVTYVSPSVEDLLGYTIQEFLALPARSLLHPDELSLTASITSDIKSGSVSSGTATYRLRHKTGDYRYFEVQWSAQRDSAGNVASIHTVGRDVTERKLAEERLAAQTEDLRSLSLRDELTTLYNRRGFLEVAEQVNAQAARAGRPAALIFVDLNGMKRINDEIGHDAGDDALKDAATVLRAALAPSDVVARLGGDEFVAFSLDFSSDELDPLRQRIRSLADAVVTQNRRPFRLSMSVGAAFSEPDAPRTLADLLERADAAMYEQKRARHAAGGVSIAPPAER
jgi:diguanylate cyclase (GGDEF)-like protein/PAS domain S-box-containing protein